MEIEKEGMKLGDTLAVKRTDMAGGRTDMAVERTAMAADRTLMAWVRTAISMISFGFTIYKFLEGANKQGVDLTRNPTGPRNLGLLLIAIGTVSLGMGMVEHWVTVKRLGKKPRFLLLSPGFLTGGAISLLGTFLFLSIILKMELF
jgi:putative membrane protein